MELVFKPLTAEFTAGLNLPQEFLYINLVPLLIIYLLQRHFLPKRAGNLATITAWITLLSVNDGSQLYTW